jgi:glucosamine--fructose-6-phosphate aminotransferase (isomerizing)
MLEVVDVVERFDPDLTLKVASEIADAGRLLLTGEGSSRLFPAKNAIRKALTWGVDLQIVTEGSRQAASYDLSNFATFAASNSGQTKEVVKLLQKLDRAANRYCYGLTAKEDNLLKKYTAETYVLTCGWEEAVAATKSVVEQALFYQSIVTHIAGRKMQPDLKGLGQKLQQVLTQQIDPNIVQTAAKAGHIYFAGLNDGVAEELTLKTNEITRRVSDYLEGTYAVHGIEEVMDSNDIVFVVEPILDELPKFQEVLVEGVGLSVIPIATQPTEIPTIVVPEAGEMNPYVFLATGWNLLVEIGLALGIDLDKPERARKVGNLFEG